jgi:mercuric ion binding protein
MKNLKLLITVLFLCVGFASYAQTKTETIKVSGNCGTCQKHIEKAAKEAGADKAVWNKKTKILSVTYDGSKTSNDAIQKKIASVGYDTENYIGDAKAYNGLDECCQYDGKKK